MQIACDNIDKLQCIEMRRRGLPRGHKWRLYELARDVHDEPLVLAAARLLAADRQRVAILTGAAVPDHMPKGENDGPFGAVVLAGALRRLGHEVRIMTDPAPAPAIRGLLDHLELDVPIDTFELDSAAEQEAAAEAFDVLVTIERLGGNSNGQLHGISGVPRGDFRVNFDALVRRATALGKGTIGIGDGGNEIGFGKIHTELAAALPELDARERTPCGGGILSVVPTDVLVVGSTSNLGAYGVCAALAILTEDERLCHIPEVELALHYVGVGLGMSDGGTGRATADCDGIPALTNAAVVRLMQTIVELELAPERQRTF